MFEFVTQIRSHPIRSAAPVVALAGLALSYYRLKLRKRGPLAEVWERVRKTVLPPLDDLARRLGVGYAAYTLGEREYAGTLSVPPEKAERLLWQAGFRRNPLAAYKTLPDGTAELGSWVYRDGLLATHQTHVVLFPAEADGQTRVFAHREYSAINPATALEHFRGRGYSPEEGEAVVRGKLGSTHWVHDEEPTADDDRYGR
ncbi:hypothetical protein [Halobaculum sp. D14]|uniref:hypothetical protein n=1 Tax=unclassified Halobaculum TaxID=2640896 RepID=UPI003EB994CC